MWEEQRVYIFLKTTAKVIPLSDYNATGKPPNHRYSIRKLNNEYTLFIASKEIMY